MGLIHFLLHALNFLAPAFVVALLVPAASRYLLRNPKPQMPWWLQATVHFVVGSMALLGGLMFFGVDGKMLTYLALVLCCATSHWLLMRGWQAKTSPRGQ